MYFGKHVEDAISEYNILESSIKKERLFNSIIYPALNKLAENVIHNRKFYNYGIDAYLDMKHDCVCHLHERLNKFQPEKGHKAFSYFNRVAINWVWANMRKVGEDTYGKCDLIEIDNYRNLDNESFNSEYNDELKDFCYKFSRWGNEHLDYFYFNKEITDKSGNVVGNKVINFSDRDKRIANAVFTLFANSGSIDIYNKKALYIMIREQVDVKTQFITDVVNVLKPLVKDMYFDYKENGTRLWHRHLYYPENVQDDDNYIQEMFDNLQENFDEQ